MKERKFSKRKELAPKDGNVLGLLIKKINSRWKKERKKEKKKFEYKGGKIKRLKKQQKETLSK